jgi:hypothetical protein
VHRKLVPIALLIVAMSTACQEYSTGLQQSVARADDTAAIAALRAIAAAERTYSITNSGEYGTLQQLRDGGFLDARFASDQPIKDYTLTLNVTQGSYKCNADPQLSGERAGRHFYIDSNSNVIYVNDTGPASASDKTLN